MTTVAAQDPGPSEPLVQALVCSSPEVEVVKKGSEELEVQ